MQYRYQTAGELRDRAKKALSGHYTAAVSITMLYAISSYMAFLFESYLSQIGTSALLRRGIVSTPAIMGLSIVLYAISAALSLWIGMMLAGIALFFLKLACGQHAFSADLYYGFREQPSKTFAVSAGILLPGLIAMLPYRLCSTMYQWRSGSVVASVAESAILVRPDARAWLYAAITLGILGGIAGFVWNLLVGLSFFLMLDFPKYSAKEILLLCAKKMNGHKMRFFRMQLGFLPLLLLGILSFGVGFLWIYPYFQETCSLFFLDLMNPKPVSGTFETRV